MHDVTNKMVWILFFAQALALACNNSCLNSCENPQSSLNCLQLCCSNTSTPPSVFLSCVITCELVDGSYVCTDSCLSTEPSCQNSCEDFCIDRKESCVESCLTEFCGHSPHTGNWEYIVGLILLVCVFVVVLYKHIAYINNKVAEEGYRALS